jgi:hypothetical protein
LKASVTLAAAIACFVAPLFAQTPGNPIGAKTWIGHAQEMEDFIKGAEVASMKARRRTTRFTSHLVLEWRTGTDRRVCRRNSLIRSKGLMPSTHKGSDYAKRAAVSALPSR